MANDSGSGPRTAQPVERLRDLTDTYRRVLTRYRGIAALAQDAAQHLRAAGDVASMNTMLGRKRILLQEIREEEERVTGDREWWKQSRQTLPTQECRELLSLLDAIGTTLETTLEHEEECRTLLRDRTTWKAMRNIARPATGESAAGAAETAYRLAASAGERSTVR